MKMDIYDEEYALKHFYEEEQYMKSKLKAVPPKQAEPSKPKMLIYGKPGVGKTWASLDFPNVYYIDTEGGANLSHYTDKLEKSGGVYYGMEQGSLSFENIIEQLYALATEKHEFKTVVIDSITKIFALEVAKESERLGDKNVFGADKKPALSYMRKLTNIIQRLDMNVILIAHEKAEWGLDEKKQRIEVGSTFDCWDKLEYELHLCLHIINIAGQRKAKVRKSRLKGFPEASLLNWSYKDFAEAYGKDIIERKSTNLVLATQEQLREFNYLLQSVKLPDNLQSKWLTGANVDSFEEMDSDKLQKIIDYIKIKILPTIMKGE